MKKKVLFGTGIIASWALVAFATSALADNNFITQMTMDASHVVLNHANDKTNQLVNSIDDNVKAKLQDKIDQTVDEKNQYVDSQLQSYYDQKIDDFVNSDAQTVTQPIDAAANNAVTNNKKAIDKAFADLLNR